MSAAMSVEKNPATASRKKYSRSTCHAAVEAASGNSSESRTSALPFALFAPQQDEDEGAQREDGRRAGDPKRAHDDEAVAADHRVVVVAIEEERVDSAADLAVRRFHEREPQIA